MLPSLISHFYYHCDLQGEKEKQLLLLHSILKNTEQHPSLG